MRRAVLQTAIILFCIWHMFAVFIFSVPRDAQDSFSVSTRIALLPIVTPYMLITSQWQLWNLFAPDPLRRIDEYRIDVNERGAWTALTTIQPGSYPWRNHATHFKLFMNLFDDPSSYTDPAKKRLLQLLACTPYHLVPDTTVRMTDRFAVEPDGNVNWTSWSPAWTEGTTTITSCPAS